MILLSPRHLCYLVYWTAELILLNQMNPFSMSATEHQERSHGISALCGLSRHFHSRLAKIIEISNPFQAFCCHQHQRMQPSLQFHLWSPYSSCNLYPEGSPHCWTLPQPGGSILCAAGWPCCEWDQTSLYCSDSPGGSTGPSNVHQQISCSKWVACLLGKGTPSD